MGRKGVCVCVCVRAKEQKGAGEDEERRREAGEEKGSDTANYRHLTKHFPSPEEVFSLNLNLEEGERAVGCGVGHREAALEGKLTQAPPSPLLLSSECLLLVPTGLALPEQRTKHRSTSSLRGVSATSSKEGRRACHFKTQAPLGSGKTLSPQPKQRWWWWRVAGVAHWSTQLLPGLLKLQDFRYEGPQGHCAVGRETQGEPGGHGPFQHTGPATGKELTAGLPRVLMELLAHDRAKDRRGWADFTSLTNQLSGTPSPGRRPGAHRRGQGRGTRTSPPSGSY